MKERRLKNLLIIILFIVSFETWAQQGLQMEFTEIDSTQLVVQRQLEYYQLISGNSAFLNEDFALPEFNIQEGNTNNYNLNLDYFSLGNYNITNVSLGSMSTAYSPYYRNGTVLSSAAYRLGEKFTLGGFSYGANSMYSAPFPNKDANTFDAYGSTIFMEYKVSKNFKIGTRVNVQQGGHPPGF